VTEYYGSSPWKPMRRLGAGSSGESRGEQFLHNVAQDNVVFEQLLVDFREALKHRGLREQLFAHAHESADHVHAHGDGVRTAQEHGSHQGAVLGEDPG
jgi:hypothetical protein